MSQKYEPWTPRKNEKFLRVNEYCSLRIVNSRLIDEWVQCQGCMQKCCAKSYNGKTPEVHLRWSEKRKPYCEACCAKGAEKVQNELEREAVARANGDGVFW